MDSKENEEKDIFVHINCFSGDIKQQCPKCVCCDELIQDTEEKVQTTLFFSSTKEYNGQRHKSCLSLTNDRPLKRHLGNHDGDFKDDNDETVGKDYDIDNDDSENDSD